MALFSNHTRRTGANCFTDRMAAETILTLNLIRDSIRLNNATASCHRLPGPLPALQFPIARLRLRFSGTVHQNAARYLGSAWRGVFWRALYNLVCVTRCVRCQDCLLYRSCVYPYIFETPPPDGARKHGGYPAVPHPFVLDLPFTGPAQGARCVGLTLIGRAVQFIAYAVHAFRSAGERGLRGVSGPLSLVAVEQEIAPGSGVWRNILEGNSLHPIPSHIPPPPPSPPRAVLYFRTPGRLRIQDRYIAPEDFQFCDFFSTLLRRLSLLTYFHTETPLEIDFAALARSAREVRMSAVDIAWQDWTRYSSRQHKHMQMGGLVGSFAIEGDLEPFWPYLWAGQFVHAGKGSGMGLGRYDLVREA